MKRRRWFSSEAVALCKAAGEVDAAMAIKKLAADLVDVAFDAPPFDPAVLASFQGVVQIRRRPMNSAARLVPESSGLVIEVNQDHPLGKQNLSINHETTHTLLPSYCGRRIDDAETGTFPSSSALEEELLCDIGGAALLLDARWLKPFAIDSGPGLATLFSLAEFFGASLQATAWQLSELDIWPMAIVFWEEGLRKDQRATALLPTLPGFEELGHPSVKLRANHVYTTTSFNVFIPLNKSVSDSSLVAACCESCQTTYGIERFDFGRHMAELFCQNAYAPYGRGSSFRRRVISWLQPVNRINTPVFCPPIYPLRLS